VSLSETPEQHEERLQLQVAQIASAAPDLVFLQEVNPLPDKAERMVASLARRGLDYDEIHLVESCGLRLSRQIALIPELNSGHAILAKKYLHLKKLARVRTLGGFGMCRKTMGFQLQELRYALVGEVTSPTSGEKYLVANVHNHSGLDVTGEFLDQLEDWRVEGRFPDGDDVRKQFDTPIKNRKRGLAALMKDLDQRLDSGRYEGLLVAGDFNFAPHSAEYEKAIRLGLIDTHAISSHEGELYSLDPIRNDLVFDGDEPEVSGLLQAAIAKGSPEAQQELLEAYIDDMRRPRRIDYVFVKSFLSGVCVRQQLFGQELGSDGLPASDHYGVLNTWYRDTSECRREAESISATIP